MSTPKVQPVLPVTVAPWVPLLVWVEFSAWEDVPLTSAVVLPLTLDATVPRLAWLLAEVPAALLVLALALPVESDVAPPVDGDKAAAPWLPWLPVALAV